jgi:heme/copper-type cytochrome/quinol oxidase subunit 2
VTIPGLGFSLLAKAGQTVTGEFTFDKPGIFDFYCSIPGYKDAGMKGTVTVGTQAMAGMPGMAAASSPDIKPLPADLKPLSAPQIAPPSHAQSPRMSGSTWRPRGSRLS